MTDFIKRTIEVAKENVKKGGRPFACIIVQNGKIIAEGTNEVVQTKDPTAHSEIVAIRKAAAKLNSEHLSECEFYIMDDPCPMCLAALYYCSPLKATFITFREEYKEYYTDDKKNFTFDDFYKEMSKSWQQRHLKMIYHSDPDAMNVFKLWKKMND